MTIDELEEGAGLVEALNHELKDACVFDTGSWEKVVKEYDAELVALRNEKRISDALCLEGSQVIDELRAENTSLEQQVASLNAALAHEQEEAGQLKAERDTARTERNWLRGEVERLNERPDHATYRTRCAQIAAINSLPKARDEAEFYLTQALAHCDRADRDEAEVERLNVFLSDTPRGDKMKPLNQKPRQRRFCPECQKSVAISASGAMAPHNRGYSRQFCKMSGRPAGGLTGIQEAASDTPGEQQQGEEGSDGL